MRERDKTLTAERRWEGEEGGREEGSGGGRVRLRNKRGKSMMRRERGGKKIRRESHV